MLLCIKNSTLFIQILFFALISCKSNSNNVKSEDSGGTGLNSIYSDTTQVSATVVEKGTFIKETWCNGKLQAWQKAIVPIITQIQPENRAHIYSTYTVHILFIMFALVELALILLMASYLPVNIKLVLNLLMTV